MRMRKKRNLDSRVDNCKNYIPVIKSTEIMSQKESERYDIFDYKKYFNNDNPLYLELGCGKGRFLLNSALKNPDINYIGVEIIQNVIVSAGELLKANGVKNATLFNTGVELLPYLLEKNSVDKIYLNFSCPYPKKQYENRRLTSKLFLQRYKYLLKDGGYVELKTDNENFFDYSVNSLIENGFIVEYQTRDLYGEDVLDNVQTEYEEKFVNNGFKIFKLIAKIKE